MNRLSVSGISLFALVAFSLLSCSEGPTGPAPIANVTISASTLTLASGATATLSATALDAKGIPLAGRVFAWTSADASIASVSGGLVTAGQNRGASPASTTIAVVSEGKSASATVTVTPVPAARVVLTPDSVLVVPGANTTLTAAVEDAGGAALTGRSVTWQSVDTTVARVTTAGLVTAVAYAGPASRETHVIATAEGRADTTRVIVPPVTVARVVLTPDSVALQAGTTRTFTAVAQDAAGTALTGRTIAWGTTDSSVVTISTTGVLTAVAYAGSATRTARLFASTAGKADTSPVVVTPVPVGRLNATPDSLALLPGGTATLTAAVTDSVGGALTGRSVIWTATDTTVATISVAGVVTAQAYTGGASRTALLIAASETKRDTTRLTVTPLPVNTVAITGAPADSVLLLGGTLPLGATLSGIGGVTLTGRSVSWSASATTIATVSAAGLVSPVAAGTVVLTVTSEGKSASTTVLVRAPVTVPPATATQPVTTTVLSGAVTLTVPPGATTTATTLTVAPAPTAPVDDRALPGAAYVFGPAGTTFTTPVTIGFRYDPAVVPVAKRAKLRVALVTPNGLSEVPGGTLDAGASVFSAQVRHFSTYTLVVPADPASLTVLVGGGQTAIVGTALPTALQVRVRDAQGRPISRERVRFTVATGGGTLSDTASVVTDTTGTATMPGTWTLGSTIGTQTLTATVVGTTVTGTVSATGLPVPDTTPAAITGPSGSAGAATSARSIPEHTTAVHTFTANEPVTWSLAGGVDQARFAIGPTTGTLAFVTPPDFEVPTDADANSTYLVTVRATDAAGNVSKQVVTVTVTDVDDTAPAITGPSGGSGAAASAKSIPENTTAVHTFTANEPVTWSLDGGADAAKFTIDPAGTLRFLSAPDFETPSDLGATAANNTYVVTVKATDLSGNAALQVVTVTVTDVDDTTPTITGPSGGAGAATSAKGIPENTTAVHTFAANEAVTWSLAGGADQARFAIDPATGALRFPTAPDFEAPTDADANNTYLVTVRATDLVGNTAIQAITVTVTDADDTAPVITGPAGAAGAATSAKSIPEGTSAVHTFTANEAVTWSLAGGADQARFAIDPATGALRFLAAPDFETPTDVNADNIYSVTVRATDAGGNASTQSVTVSVSDVDETAPTITGPSGATGAAASTKSVAEGTSAVFTFTANEPVTWSVSGGADAAKFAIDAATGALRFVTAPDYESPTDADANNTYLVTVRATDAAGNVGTQIVTVTVSDVAESATQFAVNAGNSQTATAGSAVATAPSVVARDASGNPVAGVSVTFAVASGGGSITGGSATTNASGIAAVGSWTLGTTAGVNTLTATSAGLTGSPLTFTATGTAGVATRYQVTVPTNSPAAGSTVTITAQLADANGNAVITAGQIVTWSKSSASGSFASTTSTTNASGLATVGFTAHTVAGTATTITATDGSGRTGTSATITTVAGPATQLAISAGNNQTATVGAAVATPPSVVIRDTSGNPVAGVGVTFAVASGGGSITGGSTTTNASGIATVGSWTLGTTAGTNTLTVTSAGLTGSPLTFTATGAAGAATQMAINSGNNQTATVGTTVATPPSVVVRDVNGNPVAGVTVNFALVSGGGSLTGGAATTNTSGIATAGSWTLGTTAGTNTLAASSTGLTGSPLTFTATGSASAATRYVITAPSTSVVAGSTITITAQLVDVYGNAAPVAWRTVSWSKSTLNGSFGSATSTTTASGRASVSFTAHTLAGTSTTISAIDDAAISGTSAPLITVAGSATSAFLLDAETQVTRVGTATQRQPGVRLIDAFGNRVPGVPITFSAASGGGFVTGASTLTDAQGEARVASWTMGLSSTTNTLSIQVPGFSNGTVYGRAVPFSNFPISIRLVSGTSPQYLPLLNDAADRWRKAIIAGASNSPISYAANSCFAGQPAINESTAGVIVFVEVVPIDGAGGILAQASRCLWRSVSGITAVGQITFDQADLDTQIAEGSAFGTAVHEIGHILRIGSGWDFWGLRQDVGTIDPIFVGTNARIAFDFFGGGSYPGRTVPLENNGGNGTRDVHWRESVMGRELMTPSILSGQTAQPFSAITLYALADMGYGITELGYDDYFVSSNNSALREDIGRHQIFREDLDIRRGQAIDERTGALLSSEQQATWEQQFPRKPPVSSESRPLPISTPAIPPKRLQ